MYRTPLLPLALFALAGCVPELESDGGEDQDWVAPSNSWPVDAPPFDLRGEGFYEGQVIPEFRLHDQYGDEVSLWQFHGRPVVVDISTMWCAPCRVLAEGAEQTYQDWQGDGLIYVTVLPENVEGGDPSTDDLTLWADEYGLTSPVVADPGEQWSGPAVPQDQYPYVAVIDVDMTIAAIVSPPTDANLRAALSELMP